MAIPRCTCGYTVFYEKVSRATTWRERWRRVTGLGGFGSVPFGLNMGGFGGRSWGRFLLQVTSGLLHTTCKSCHRVRRSVPIGGGTPMGTWASSRVVYVLVTDSASAGCLFGRFQTSEGRTFEVPARRAFPDVPYLEGAPLTVADALPVDAVAAETTYSFTLPSSAGPGSYHFLLHDRCLNTVQSLYSLNAGEG